MEYATVIARVEQCYSCSGTDLLLSCKSLARLAALKTACLFREESKMKTRVLTLVAASLVVGSIAVGAAPAVAKGVGSLAAPTLTTTFDATSGADELNYSCVPGAVKYAIEAVAVYCVAGSVDSIVSYDFSSTSCGAIQPAFDFSVLPSTLTIDVCLPGNTCPVPDAFTPIEPTEVSYKVKGLAVPRGPHGRQNNPFSNWSPPLPDLATVCD
jgi:hypothetical protein